MSNAHDMDSCRPAVFSEGSVFLPASVDQSRQSDRFWPTEDAAAHRRPLRGAIAAVGIEGKFFYQTHRRATGVTFVSHRFQNISRKIFGRNSATQVLIVRARERE
jgi:hypothetical protein